MESDNEAMNPEDMVLVNDEWMQAPRGAWQIK